ncbi:B3 domain-containing protein-like protein isoform X2 [Salvia divinorum]|uniref:B3 domain-containing protein-like protein isoform X2 n=1 Tax=Salvia divinorum TaxID=28513 RepID=A0ABD1G754_SALDI
MESKPAFYKILLELSSHLRLPQGFMEKYGKMLPKKVELKIGSTIWKVMVEKQKLEEEDHHFFTRGWTKFCQDVRPKIFELLVFSYVGRSTFLVTVYATSALEKSVFIAPRCIVVLKDYRCYKIHIPKKFAEACGLLEKTKVSIEYVGGYTSPVALTTWQGRVTFGAGWSRFLKANRLSTDITLHGSRKTLSLEFVPTKNLIKVQLLHH